MKRFIFIMLFIIYMAINVQAQTISGGATDLTHLLAKIDSTAVYSLASDWDYDGATGSIAATTHKVYYNHTCDANEYAICHQYILGNGVVGLDYNFSIFAVVINSGGTDSSIVFRQFACTSSIISLSSISVLDGSSVIIAGPGETLRLRAYNGDNETDAIWHNCIVERRQFE